MTTVYWVGFEPMSRESGATYRQLNYWTRLGFLESISGPHPGSGSRHQYPEVEIDVARVLRVLVPLRRKGSLVTDAHITMCAERVRSRHRGFVALGNGLYIDLDEVATHKEETERTAS